VRSSSGNGNGSGRVIVLILLIVLVAVLHLSDILFYYLRQGGYVFIGISWLVCLFVSMVMQKLLERFSENLFERWHIGQGGND